MRSTVEALQQALDAVADVDAETLSDGELDDELVALVRLCHRLDAVIARRAARWETRSVWRSDGSRAPWARLSRTAGVSAASAKRVLRLGRAVTAMPVTAEAWMAGEIGADHVGLLADAAGGRGGLFARDEALLVTHCAEFGFAQAAKVVRYWCWRADAELDRDGPEPPKPATLRLRGGFAGTVVGEFELDPIGGATVTEALRRVERDLYRQDQRNGVVRTTSVRMAAALVELAVRATTAPGDGRRPEPLVCILAGEATVEHVCELASGAIIDPRLIVSHLGRCQVQTFIFDGADRVIAAYRQRTFRGMLRRAIQVRDRHCQHPSGCDHRSPTATSTTASPTTTVGPPAKPTVSCDAKPTTATPTCTTANPPTSSPTPTNADTTNTTPANDSTPSPPADHHHPPPDPYLSGRGGGTRKHARHGRAMRQLSGVDASFLHMETPTQFGHVNSITVIDPSTMGNGVSVYAELKRTIEERMHLVDIYRRKLVADPFGLDNPYWVDDPDLDLEFHIREIALPAPGDARQLAEQVARLAARPLDRSRPLWEWYVISGLEGGLVGLFMKLHHATIDGASGVELLHVLLDTDPEGRDIEPPEEPWRPEPTPTSLELVGRALWSYALRPQKLVQYQMRLMKDTVRMTRNPAVRDLTPSWMRSAWPWSSSTDRSNDGPQLTATAPPTPFNRAITAHRRFAFCTVRLSDVQAVKRTLGVTVNDVVMAMCASVLRRYLEDRDALPDESLIAMVPVSVRTGDESDTYSNRVTAVMCPLHTHLADPVERVMAIHESMAAAKELQRAIPADVLTDVTQFTPPALAAMAARVGSMIKIADRMRPPANLIISNVPGPREPLYLSGGVVRHYYPVSGVAEGMGLNMTVQSYLDNLDFGLISCRELVPDLWDLCDLLPDALAELEAAAAT